MNKLLKHIFTVLLFVISISFSTHAQRRFIPMRRQPEFNRVEKPNPEARIEGVEERFVTRQLNLTPEQLDKFLPLYQEYHRELFNIRKLKRLNNTSAQANGTDQINKELQYDADIVSIRQRFKDAFLKILPPEKVSELYKSEREFNDELVRQLSERSTPPAN